MIEDHVHTKFAHYIDESLQVCLLAEISCQLQGPVDHL